MEVRKKCESFEAFETELEGLTKDSCHLCACLTARRLNNIIASA